jgi:hypothetical protein
MVDAAGIMGWLLPITPLHNFWLTTRDGAILPFAA